MIRRILGTLLLIAVVGIAFNDATSVLGAQKRLREVTFEMARWAGENAQGMNRNQAAAKLLADAQAQGFTLYAYDQTDQGAKLFTSGSVSGTIVAGPIMNLMVGMPFGEALSTPLTIRDSRSVGFAG